MVRILLAILCCVLGAWLMGCDAPRSNVGEASSSPRPMAGRADWYPLAKSVAESGIVTAQATEHAEYRVNGEVRIHLGASEYVDLFVDSVHVEVLDGKISRVMAFGVKQSARDLQGVLAAAMQSAAKLSRTEDGIHFADLCKDGTTFSNHILARSQTVLPSIELSTTCLGHGQTSGLIVTINVTY